MLLQICAPQETLAQTLACPVMGSITSVFYIPPVPDTHSCAQFFGTANAEGTADGKGLCKILELGFADSGPCSTQRMTASVAQSSWWDAHLFCTQETSDCVDTSTGPASSQPWSTATAVSPSCYRV